jgi:phosphoglycerate dehydrogenase-like enzyme
MKLVIYDPAWKEYRPRLRSAVTTPWNIVAGANDPLWLAEEIRDADALLAVRLSPELRGAACRLKLLAFPGAGVMHSDANELPAGCVLTNVFEHGAAIAEYVVMCILQHVSMVRRYDLSFRQGRWDGSGRVGGEPHEEALGKRLGMIGYGHIGQAVALRANAFGIEVNAICRQPNRPLGDDVPELHSRRGTDALEDLLQVSDFVLVACPLNAQTRGMIGVRQLALMRRGALLINVARAEIVQEEPLYDAVSEGWICAALDAWYRYPDNVGETLHGSRFPFHGLENVTLTPHFSAWTTAMIDRRMRSIAANLDRLARGEPLARAVLCGTWEPESQLHTK